MSNAEMPVYEEITQIAHKNDEISALIREIGNEINYYGYDWVKRNFVPMPANAKARDKIAQLAKKNQEFQAMIEDLGKKIDIEGMDFKTTKFVEDCREENGQLISPEGRLDNQGLVDNKYYCYQESGYMEDDEVGTMYFRTATPGLYVGIDFDK